MPGKEANRFAMCKAVMVYVVLLFMVADCAKKSKHEAPKHVFDTEAMEVEWGKLSDYQVGDKLGKGKYSEAYECKHIRTNVKYVCKILRQDQEYKTLREIKIARILQGGPNIIKLIDTVKGQSKNGKNKVALVFERVESENYKTLYPMLDDMQVRYYFHELLYALAYVHSKGIMHRDIKPHNTVYDLATKKLRLIDFGLSEWYDPARNYSLSVASRWYKPPELLIGVTSYDYAMDIWAIACMFATTIYQFTPFYDGEDEEDQLKKIVQVLGSEKLFAWVKKENLYLDEKLASSLKMGERPYKARNWTEFIDSENEDLVSLEAMDLLNNIMRVDPKERFTAKQALQHKYFDPIRALAPKRDLPGDPLPKYVQPGWEDFVLEREESESDTGADGAEEEEGEGNKGNKEWGHKSL